MKEWISINDNLPLDCQKVFVTFEDKEVFIVEWEKIEDDYYNKFSFTGGFWFGEKDGTETFAAYEDVTHWMPIDYPPPAKDE